MRSKGFALISRQLLNNAGDESIESQLGDLAVGKRPERGIRHMHVASTRWYARELTLVGAGEQGFGGGYGGANDQVLNIN